MKKTLALSAATFAVALTLVGCSTNSGSGSMPGMDHGSTSSASGSPSSSVDHNSADTTFAQMMIPHHAQAVSMSDMILAKTGVPSTVTALATKIKAAQGPEIGKMTGWLKAWNESTQMSGSHGMSGMMSDDDLAKLKAAQGVEAAKLFLTQMVAHHEGAVAMAKTEQASGKNADTVALAKSISTSQEAEIQEMKNLLGTL